MNKTTIDRIQASKQKEGGFTLIELLIVIVILGILAGVVIFASAGFKNKGAAESCKTTVSTVKTAAEAFHVDSPDALYPQSWVHLTTVVALVGGPYFDENGTTWQPAAGALPARVQGKGWYFPVTWGAAAAAGTGSTTAPAPGACVIA